jgi:protein-S-isoprenylcysteine O-methyltransferase Ste14
MYVGFLIGWIGLWIVFGWLNWPAIVVAFLVALGVMAFVRLYEEPTLRKLFGPAYDEYRRNVPRWIPRFTPWESSSGS